MKGYTSISGKKIVEESAIESSRIWVGVVFQDGLINFSKKIMPKTIITKEICKKAKNGLIKLKSHGTAANKLKARV